MIAARLKRGITPRIKLAGAIAVAILAFSATASLAQAKFMTTGNVTSVVLGTQIGTNVLSVEGNKASCTTTRLESPGVASPASVVTVHPTYESCTIFGFVGSTITTTGCDYKLAGGATELSPDKFTGAMEIVCEAGKSIVIVAGTCEVTIGGLQFLSEMTFTDNTAASPKDVVLKWNEALVVVNKVKDGFLCPLGGTGSTNGVLTGESTMKAFEGFTQVGFTVEL